MRVSASVVSVWERLALGVRGRAPVLAVRVQLGFSQGLGWVKFAEGVWGGNAIRPRIEERVYIYWR